MALKSSIALFIWGKGDLSPYAQALSTWSHTREYVTVFSDDPKASQIHYLLFPELMKKSGFDLIVHDIADTVHHSVAFHYLIKWPGALFFNSIALPTFSRGTSHSPFDEWGYKLVLNVVVPDEAEKIARMDENGIDTNDLFKRNPLAYALAVRSAAVVVNDYKSALMLESKPHVPPLSIIEFPDSPAGQKNFENAVDKMIPLWCKRSEVTAETIPAINHPHLEMMQVEKSRISDRFDSEQKLLSQFAADALESLSASEDR